MLARCVLGVYKETASNVYWRCYDENDGIQEQKALHMDEVMNQWRKVEIAAELNQWFDRHHKGIVFSGGKLHVQI